MKDRQREIVLGLSDEPEAVDSSTLAEDAAAPLDVEWCSLGLFLLRAKARLPEGKDIDKAGRDLARLCRDAGLMVKKVPGRNGAIIAVYPTFVLRSYCVFPGASE